MFSISAEDVPWVGRLYPGEDTPELQTRLDEAVAWVAYYAPCVHADGFPETKQALIRNLVRRAMEYEAKSGQGVIESEGMGPFNRRFDTRTPASPNLFHPSQVVILRGLCSKGAGQAQSVKLGMPYVR